MSTASTPASRRPRGRPSGSRATATSGRNPTGSDRSVTRRRPACSSVTYWSSPPPAGSPSWRPSTRAWSSAGWTPIPDPTAPGHADLGPAQRAGDLETLYVGRLGVRDAEYEPLVVDWRAPAAEPFYRATSAHRLGVVRRRVLRCQGPSVVGLEDDLLAPEQAPDDLPVIGEGALMASLSRARGHTMRDIVATIQAEQDTGDPRSRPGGHRDRRRSGYRQDGGRAAPRGVPALLRPPPLRARWGAGGRAVGSLHGLHRASPSQPRREHGVAARGRRTGRRRDCDGGRPDRSWLRSRARHGCAACSAGRPATGFRPHRRRCGSSSVALRSRSTPRRSTRSAATRCAGPRATRRCRKPVAECSPRCGIGSRSSCGPAGSPTGRRSPTPSGDLPGFARFLADWWPALTPAEVLGWLGDVRRVRRWARHELPPGRGDLLQQGGAPRARRSRSPTSPCWTS